jgi:hypothetical protein
VGEEDAARKYDEAAREHHGEKAVLNFVTDDDLKVRIGICVIVGVGSI